MNQQLSELFVNLGYTLIIINNLKIHSLFIVKVGTSWKSTINRSKHYYNLITMGKSSGLKNAPSTTGNPSGGGRGNNSSKGK